MSLKGNVVREKADSNANNNDTKWIFSRFKPFEFHCLHNISPLILQVGSFYVPWALCYPYVLLSFIHIKRSTETEGIPSKVLRWKELLGPEREDATRR